MRKNVLLLITLAALGFTSVGCTSAELKADEATAASDLHTGGLILAGIGGALESTAAENPGLLAEGQALGDVLLQKAGVSAATADKLTSALNEGNGTKIKAAGLEIASVGSTLSNNLAKPAMARRKTK